MVQEARLEAVDAGLVPASDGWFVVNVADAAGARVEEGIAHRVERLARHEDDELAVQVSVSICAFCSLPL